MKTHVSHEIRIHRLAGFAMIIAVMSLFTYRTREFHVSYPVFQSQAGSRFSASTAPATSSEIITEANKKQSSAPSPAAETVNIGAASKSATLVAGTFTIAEMLEFALPEAEEALKLEDWMVDAEFWESPAEVKGVSEGTAQAGDADVPGVEAASTAGPAIGSPEWVAEKSVIDVEPPLVWTTESTAFNEWIVPEISSGAVPVPLEFSYAFDLVGDFDCEAALKSQIRLNEAMVEETEAPLRLESWMLDESLFSPELKAKDSSAGIGASENRKLRNPRN